MRTAPPRAAPSTPEQEVERRILGAGLRFTALAVAFQSVVHLVNLLVFDLQIDFFNAESDTSFFAYTSSVATLACGAMVLLLARPRRVVRVGLALLAAAIVMEILGIVVVSLDTSRLPYELQVTLEEGTELGAWMAIAVALAAGVLDAFASRARAGVRVP